MQKGYQLTMTSQAFPPLCSSCARRDYTKPWVCEAFPEGIPEGIHQDLGDHRAPWPGDGGLRYVMLEGAEEDLRQWQLARSITGGSTAAASAGDVDVSSTYLGESPTMADFTEAEQEAMTQGS
jgi:hypothetical protein